ncbi:MAG: PDDEXK nuclease domain-containing protein [bacterium]
MKNRKKVGFSKVTNKEKVPAVYDSVLKDVIFLINEARRISARSINAIMTATYWRIGKRIVEFEQGGKKRAEYGKQLLKRLADDLTQQYSKGFSERNLEQMRNFYLAWPISQTLSAKSFVFEKSQTVSAISDIKDIATHFLLPWSSYVRLLSIKNEHARRFYEKEALRVGWSVRQLDRQINSMFYERVVLSKNKAEMLKKGAVAKHEDIQSPEEEIKDPYVLEFLKLKDEYSENDLEEALILHLEKFLIELGGDFTFVGRQKRLRIGDEWYRVDLIFFHRKLRCLVVIDLKIGKFTHADAGQMHMYLNYASEHWTNAGENPPVGLILCAKKNEAVAKYALSNLPNKVMASEYKIILPDEKIIEEELEKTRKLLESRKGK